MTVQIFFIYAENCEHCTEALGKIESAILKCKKIPCEIKKISYDSPVAISIAINKGIDDLPGIVVGEKTFVKHCSEEAIIEAIKKAY